MGKRATTDRGLDKIISSILDIIEPPSCHKSHCPHNTAYSFCNCSKNLVPGKCPLNLKYLKDKKERDEKTNTELATEISTYYNIDIEAGMEAIVKFERHHGSINHLKDRMKKLKEKYPEHNGINSHLNIYD